MKTSRETVAEFKGLNNVTDPLALDLTWLKRADDCIVTDRGKLQRARGFAPRIEATRISGAYATDDLQRLYLVDDGTLYQVAPDLSLRALAGGLSSAPMRFTEVNGVVYYSNGVDLGVIDNQGARAWGIDPPPPIGAVTQGVGILEGGQYQACCTLVDSRGLESGNGRLSLIEVDDGSLIVMTGIPQVAGFTTNVYVTAANGDAFLRLATGAPATLTYNCAPADLGTDLPFLFDNKPHGVLPAYFAGCMYLADPYPTLDVSAIWKSHPLNFHLFDDGDEGYGVPGTVLMQAACGDESHPSALIIGTERAIYSLDETGKLDMLAPYGVVPGDHACKHRGELYFWSLRGLCKAMPFVNLTESTVSVSPGVSAAGKVIEQEGFRRFYAALQAGGVPYNRRSAGAQEATPLPIFGPSVLLNNGAYLLLNDGTPILLN